LNDASLLIQVSKILDLHQIWRTRASNVRVVVHSRHADFLANFVATGARPGGLKRFFPVDPLPRTHASPRKAD
jgi:hypothetical protein